MVFSIATTATTAIVASKCPQDMDSALQTYSIPAYVCICMLPLRDKHSEQVTAMQVILTPFLMVPVLDCMLFYLLPMLTNCGKCEEL